MKHPLRISRWSPCNTRAEAVGPEALPTAIVSPMTSEQLDAYLIHFRIQEITQVLRGRQVDSTTTNPARRSPSPEPEYDAAGRRTNTRPQRYIRRLQQERHSLVREAVNTIPRYQPPSDYRPETSVTAKVFVPVSDHPHVGFIGQILGPRGMSLKAINTDSGAKVVIRGRGSVKEGRRSRGARPLHRHVDDHDPLHCLIIGDTSEQVEKAKKMVQQVIDNAILAPEWANERKQKQLRDLAKMNGTFRDDEGHQSKLIEGGSSIITPAVTPATLGAVSDPNFEREYEQLLLDVGVADASRPVTSPKLPPWRVDRELQRHRYY